MGRSNRISRAARGRVRFRVAIPWGQRHDLRTAEVLFSAHSCNLCLLRGDESYSSWESLMYESLVRAAA